VNIKTYKGDIIIIPQKNDLAKVGSLNSNKSQEEIKDC